jgi:hypothetical protein
MKGFLSFSLYLISVELNIAFLLFLYLYMVIYRLEHQEGWLEYDV